MSKADGDKLDKAEETLCTKEALDGHVELLDALAFVCVDCGTGCSARCVSLVTPKTAAPSDPFGSETDLFATALADR